MGSEQLVTMKLIDLCELIIDCPHSTPKWTDSGYIVLRNQNIRNGSLDLSSPSFTDENGYKSRIKRAEPKAGDLVLTREAPMGEVCLIPKGLKCCLGQRQVLLRPKKEVSGEYLFWALQSPFVQHQVSWNEGTGTTVSNIRIPVLKAFEIPRWFQHESMIASHLSAIRNKIDLNRQINQTLEQIAQTLFKSWFVDFDPVIDNALDAGFFEQDLAFSEELLHRVELRKAVRESDNFKPLPEDIRQLFPDTFEECAESVLGLGGWVPKGWHYDCFGKLLSSTIGGDWGKDAQDEKHTVQSRIVRGTDIPDLSNGQLSDAPLRWVEPKKLKSRQIEVGDIIIEVSGGSPTQSTGRSLFITQLMLERLGGVVEPASFCRRFEPKSYTLGMLASIHLKKIYSDGKMWEYQNQSTGIANFQTKFFLDAEQVLIPSDEVLDKFIKIIQPFIEKSQNNEQIELTKLRDTLLPKLISGELSLSDIKIDTPEEILI